MLKSSKKILVFGSTGMVGTVFEQAVNDTDHSLLKITRDIFDIEKDHLKPELISDADYIVNFAGIINSKITEDNEKAVYLCNTLFPSKLSELCDAHDKPLIHMSTDCVFSGDKGCYSESDLPDARDLYGRSKIEGECQEASMVIRTSVIGPEQKDFKSLLCWFLNQEGSCYGYTNHLWNGLTSLTLSRVILSIIDNNMYKRGVQHFYSNDVSKYELLNIIKSKFDKDIKIEPTDTAPPKDMRLSSIRPEYVANFQIPSLEKQIEDLVDCSDGLGKWIKND